nr:methyltransferase domain-containing protein [Micromonospora sp. DSM 115978]
QHTGPALTDTEREELAARNIRIVEGEVTGLEVADDQLAGVRLRSGEVVECRALVVAPRFVAKAGLLASLGLQPVELKLGDYVMGESVPADPFGATAVPGVWVAGNVTDLRAQVITSAAAGLNAGAAINADLVAEDTRDAVAAYRHRTASHSHAHSRADADADADGQTESQAEAQRVTAEQYWEDRYQQPHSHWSGKANLVLVDVVGGLRPGAALDLGCGDGSDAIWLATQGWRVTSVDISATALARAAERAEADGVTGIDWQRHDLT